MKRAPMPALRARPIVLAAFIAIAVPSALAGPAPAALVDQLHSRAVQSFRVGRYAEAYGRFVLLADAGHGPSARVALWMCEHGSSLFGHAWDCTPHQIEDWALAAGVPQPRILPSIELRAVPPERIPTGANSRPVQPQRQH